jgi:hypothetical protein
MEFENLVKNVLKMLELDAIKLGNVEFWVDREGPWKGQLAYSVPVLAWDLESVKKDLVSYYATALEGVPF